jgi:predicted nucleic acid-binding protein
MPARASLPDIRDLTGTVLVDSCVLLDVLTEDADWVDWSAEMLARVGDQALLAINPVIYAEISIGFHRIEELEEAMPPDWVTRLDIPWEAAFLAGKCFLRYRRAGGRRAGTLPDFFIGAHAAVQSLPLLTRDVRRYRSYFPTLRVISPQ